MQPRIVFERQSLNVSERHVYDSHTHTDTRTHTVGLRPTHERKHTHMVTSLHTHTYSDSNFTAGPEIG